jgi:hypothetical protein
MLSMYGGTWVVSRKTFELGLCAELVDDHEVGGSKDERGEQ